MKSVVTINTEFKILLVNSADSCREKKSEFMACMWIPSAIVPRLRLHRVDPPLQVPSLEHLFPPHV